MSRDLGRSGGGGGGGGTICCAMDGPAGPRGCIAQTIYGLTDHNGSVFLRSRQHSVQR